MKALRLLYAFVGWLLNTLVLLAVAVLVIRAAVEFVTPLGNLVPVKFLMKWLDPTLEYVYRSVGLPWSRDGRGLGLPVLAALLYAARSFAGEAADRFIDPLLRPKPKAMPPAPRPAAPAPGAAAPGSGVDHDAATMLLPPSPVQSVTGTQFLPSQGSSVPTRIGRYEILSELGRGAMGTVYKANDPRIGRTVAIKTISAVGMGPEMEEYRARFLIEAKSAGRLSHPGVVGVYDVTEDDHGRPCLVLEFVDGRTLDKVVSESASRLPLPQALDYIAQVARALGYAHEQGIVHRDVKPANIMVTASGQAKLSDFGIAKIEGTTLTIAGQVLGTPAFMSPEQCKGSGVDARSDIFSLGAVLYTLVCGIKPFPGDTFTSVAYKVVHTDPVPAREINPDLPPELERILSRCLAKDSTRRYPSATTLAEDIEALRRGTLNVGAGSSAGAEAPPA